MVQINIRNSALVIGLLAPLAAFLGERAWALSLVYFNAPGRMQTYTNFTSHEIKFASKIRNCEDALLIEPRGLAILACDPGRETWNTVMGDFFDQAEPDANAELYAYRYAEPSLLDVESLVRIEVIGFDSELRTIGIEYHEPSSTLFVTNHPRHGPRIEQFYLDLKTLTATHVRTLSHPLITTPNSIVALSASDFLVTNQHYFTARDYPRLFWAFESYLAPPLGSIVHVRILEDSTLDAAVIARQAYPNGIALLNGTTLAVAATNKRLVYLYSISNTERTHPSLKFESSIWLPFLPDNLSVSKRGGPLLIAGHPHLPSLNAFARSRRVCHRPDVLTNGGQHALKMCVTAGAASWASEWTPEHGVRHIYSGWEYPSSASVVRDPERGVGIVAGLYARGLLVWWD